MDEPGRPGRADARRSRSELRLATASCQHWETGFYAAHRDLAEWAPDLVVFLGDFIYEGAGRPIARRTASAAHDGAEPTDLAAYRARYAQYLSDPDLQAARAVAPWLVVWDDHEVENNYAGLSRRTPPTRRRSPSRRGRPTGRGGSTCRCACRRPEPGDFAIHRAVRWGDLADLVLLDGRQYRSDQACGSPSLSTEPACPEAFDPARTMLGAGQEEWLGEPLAGVDGDVDGARPADRADRPAPRRRDPQLRPVGRLRAGPRSTARPGGGRPIGSIVLTGDIHLAGVGLLPGVGVEFVTASISSKGNVDPALQPILDSFVDGRGVRARSTGATRGTP